MITIDARWINTSGIGTYLRKIIPGIMRRFSNHGICLMGLQEDLLDFIGPMSSNYKIINARSEMYSIREQIDYFRLIPPETSIYFATHYNVPLLYNGRMLVTVYDLMHLAMPQFVQGFHRRIYAKFMFSAVRHKADSILTISEFTKQEMERLLGGFNQPITPIHLGVSDEWYSIPTSPSPHPRPYVLYVGNIKPHKNLKTLVKAFIAIASRVPHDLILVGKKDGFITGDVEVANLSQMLEGRIHFTGRVPDDLLKQYFHHAETLVFPSHYEGFGLPPLEAMAAGCPVVVSNVASVPEVCGDAALYFDPYDVNDLSIKLELILANNELRDALREKGLARARSFTWERSVSKTCDVIQKMLDEDAGREI
jgi:glycosyltransferase involved in cell wall biosynthesis